MIITQAYISLLGGGEGYNLFPDPLQDRPAGHPKEIAS